MSEIDAPSEKPNPGQTDSLREKWARWWQRRSAERDPTALLGPPSLTRLSLLGVICGLFSGLFILALHFLIEWLQLRSYGSAYTAGYANLPAAARFAIPAIGGLLLGLLYQSCSSASREGGIVHITERLAWHQGQLPLKNAWLQFVGAALSVASGQSVGREGAAAHIGAACGSQLGQRMELPNSTLRTLVGCGTAAGIAASFNTPLAGVIFAMEVVMMEYTITGFAPIILAAVSATAVTHLLDTGHPELLASSVELRSLAELPWLVACGVAIGLVSAVFTHGTSRLTEAFRDSPVMIRMITAGVVTGVCAAAFPQIMDVGFDSINAALAGEFGIGLALGIVLAKLVCTCVATAAAMPGGVILPSLLTGAALGGAMGVVGNTLAPSLASSPSFYALLGMGAMMGAVLQAPLTALIVILELSGSTDTVFPAMLIVVSALLVSREGLGAEGVFTMLLRQRGLDYRNDPVSQSLRRMSVVSSMDRSLVRTPARLSEEAARDLLAKQPNWLVIDGEQARATVLPASELARLLREREAAVEDGDADGDEPPAEIDLLNLPAERLEAAPIHLRATMQEALDQLQASASDCLYVQRVTRHDQLTIYGILTRETIQKTYLR